MRQVVVFFFVSHLALAQTDKISVSTVRNSEAIPISLLFTGMAGADTVNIRPAPGFSVGWAEYESKETWAHVSETLYMCQAYKEEFEGKWFTNVIHSLFYHSQYRLYLNQNDFYGGLGAFLSVRLREKKNGESGWWLIPFVQGGPTLSVGKHISKKISIEIRGTKPVFNIYRGFKYNTLYTLGLNLSYLF